jgi:hypothetical protein
MSDSEEYDSEGEQNLIKTLKKSSRELDEVREGERKLTKDLKRSTRDYEFRKTMKLTKPRNDEQAAYQGERKLIKKCRKCNKVSNLMCGQCQNTVYCSQQCQQSDWENHKKICE